MSHFCTWVFGEDAEKQLAPFCENDPRAYTVRTLKEIGEEAGIGEQAEVMAIIQQNLKTRDPLVIVSEEMITDKDGNYTDLIQDYLSVDIDTILIADGTGKFKALGHISRPNGKWDWLAIGGRWSGDLLIKPNVIPPKGSLRVGEGSALPFPLSGQLEIAIKELFGTLEPKDTPAKNEFNRLPKGLIDFKAMERRFLMSPYAQDMFKARDIVGDDKWQTFAEMQEELLPQGVDRKVVIRRYNDQPVVKRIADSVKTSSLRLNEHLLKLPQSDFKEVMVAKALWPFALLRDGEWQEKGQMGWFGMSHDKKEDLEWARECRALIDSVPDDEFITVVDCHI